MFNRKAKEIRELSDRETVAVDEILDLYEKVVNFAIHYNNLEELRGVGLGLGNRTVYEFTDGQKYRKNLIDLRRKNGIIDIREKRVNEYKIAKKVVSVEQFWANLKAPIFDIEEPNASQTSFIAGLEATGAIFRESQATKTAFEAIDMLIESLGNEAEQATSRTVLEAIKYRANHIRPIHVDDDAIFKSQQTRIDRLIENIDRFIKNEIDMELEGVYSAFVDDYNAFQVLVRNGIRIRTGMEYSALDFMRFYDKGIDVRSTVESTIAKSEEYATRKDPLTSMDMQ